MPAVAAPATAPAGLPATATTATATETARLAPGWLPDGYTATTTADLTAPDPAGTITLHVERYAKQAADAARPEGVLYLQVTQGVVDGLVDTPETTTAVTLDGHPATFVSTGAVREYRWLPVASAPDVVATVGALGGVGEEELRLVAEDVDLVGEISGYTNNALAGPAPDECNCPNSTNMKGSGIAQNDWSTDGANRQLLVGLSGNDVGVWQAILWADGISHSYNGYFVDFDDCHVDGAFGPRTKSATEWWQRTDPGGAGSPDGTNADGIVGPRTWGSADNRLALSGGAVYYSGEVQTLMFRRATAHPYDYTWSWAGSSYRYTGYSGVTLNKVAC